MDRIILHCDMNNFFASVECKLNPSIKNSPVAVCGSVEDRHGIVLAKNYIAKNFGIETAETVYQARKKCPNLITVPPHFDEYVKYSKLAFKIYENYTDLVEPFGIDECWLDVTSSTKLFGSGEEIAYKIKEEIKNKLGLTVSIGVSFNKVFAKLGSDIKKPDAVTVISRSNFKKQIWKLPACALIGVGKSTKKVLDNYYIKTIEDLAVADTDFLTSKLGKSGLFLKLAASGEDTSPVLKAGYRTPIKSVSHGVTTPENLTHNNEVKLVILELVQDISHKLKINKKCANGIMISIKNENLNIKQWQCKTPMPTQASMTIAKTAYNLFLKSYDWKNNVRAVTVAAINLTESNMPYQLNLFTEGEAWERAEKLDDCIEGIRNRFGKSSIKNASLFNNKKMPKHKPDTIVPSSLPFNR